MGMVADSKIGDGWGRPSLGWSRHGAVLLGPEEQALMPQDQENPSGQNLDSQPSWSPCSSLPM